MKYLVLVPDGAADYPLNELDGKTPLEVAKKPVIDMLAKKSFSGLVSNVPEGMVPESDTANIAILSYDPKIYSKGRSPLEAVSMGLTLEKGDIAFRFNVVTLSEEENYDERIMLDHSSDEITTPEARELVVALQKAFGEKNRTFNPGVSYRHCMIWNDPPKYTEFMRPHDIIGQKVGEYMPPEPYATLQRESVKILENHPVNVLRKQKGLKPANSIWIWSPGAKPELPSFYDKWGLKATIISAVDLIKGIGICAGTDVAAVEGATGNINTNYSGKAQAAIDAFENGSDLVYIHVEAPDECGHRAELENKVRSIELIDEKILSPVYKYLCDSNEEFSIMILPDHPTPIAKRTHTMDPVPFIMYNSVDAKKGISSFTEKNAADASVYLPNGYELMEYFIKGAASNG